MTELFIEAVMSVIIFIPSNTLMIANIIHRINIAIKNPRTPPSILFIFPRNGISFKYSKKCETTFNKIKVKTKIRTAEIIVMIV